MKSTAAQMRMRRFPLSFFQAMSGSPSGYDFSLLPILKVVHQFQCFDICEQLSLGYLVAARLPSPSTCYKNSYCHSCSRLANVERRASNGFFKLCALDFGYC